MSRYDPNRYDPVFRLEQTVKEARLMYLRGFDSDIITSNYMELWEIKKVVESVTGVKDIGKRTRKAPTPAAMQLYVFLSVKNSKREEGQIMEFVNRTRTTFYHSLKTAKNLLETDKLFQIWYNESCITIEKLRNDTR